MTDKITSTSHVDSRLRMPRIFASENCLADCEKLKKVVKRAMIEAIQDRSAQFDVVCEGAGRLSCQANMGQSAAYDQDLGTPVPVVDDFCLLGPARDSTPGTETIRPANLVSAAIDNGVVPVMATDYLNKRR